MRKKILMGLAIFGLTAGLWAQNPVAVVFDGATAANRDAFKFMKEQLGKDQADFTLVPVDL